MELKVKFNSPGACLPTRSNPTDAGLDLYSAEELTIQPGTGSLVNTGISVDFGWNTLNATQTYVGLIWDRSGLSTKNNVHRFAGVIDASYRGEIKIYLFNHGTEAFKVDIGARIAQLLIQTVTLMTPVLVENLNDTSRGTSGFGSTGN